MASIIEFIIANYIIILSVAIIILLAIIGRYAEKTNFGQLKADSPKEKKEEVKEDVPLDTPLTSDIKEDIPLDAPIAPKEETLTDIVKEEEKPIDNVELTDSIEKTQEIPVEEIKNEVEESPIEDVSTPSIDDAFSSIVPKKSVIDDDLLEDIDDLSIDGSKSKGKAIPDLDDIELPKIKSLASSDDDIWKF